MVNGMFATQILAKLWTTVMEKLQTLKKGKMERGEKKIHKASGVLEENETSLALCITHIF